MAIDPTTTTTVMVGELGSAAFNSTDLVPHEVSGVLKKGTLEDLAIFIASIIDVTGAIGFRAVQVSDGETLPATDEQEFILVGPGTYPNVGGGSAVTTTGSLNALVSNGTFWFIGVEIPIEVNGIWGDITGVLSDQTDLNDILEAKADLVGGKVPNSQLPSYVDDVVEVANYAALPGTGETGKIYVTVDTGNIYRWSGSAYIRIADESPVWGIITGTLSDQTDLQSALDGKFDVPTGDTTQYIAGDGSLITFPVAGQAGTLVRQVKNSTGSTLTKGTVVYINGASGNKPTVTKAIATGDSTSAQTFGLIQADLANNATGYVVCVGDIIGLDTSAFSEGTQLYLSSTTAGAYTSTKQYAPAHLVYIGVVTRSSSTLGQIEVRIQNGYELDELHDVAISSVANNEFIVYESSTSLWKNKSIGTVLGGTTLQFLKGNGDLDSNIYFKGSVTAGYLPKSLYPSSGDFTTSLIYDNGTSIGIGTASPSSKLHVVGKGIFDIGANSGDVLVVDKTSGGNIAFNINGVYSGQIGAVGSGDLYIASKSTYPAIVVKDGGNIGIGTASPLTALTISGNLSLFTTNQIRLYNSAKNNWTQVDSPLLSGDTEVDFRILTKTGTFYINASGNVGIGTTSPSYKLDVAGVGRFLGSIPLTLERSGSTKYTFSLGASNDFYINNVNIGSTPLTILSSGNVGIGTTSPAAKLHISNSGAAGLELSPTGGASGATYIQAYNRSTSSPSALDVYASQIAFQTSDVERMRITSAGVVCIGTTSAFDSGIVCSDGGTSYVPYTAKIGTTASSTQMFFRNPNGVVGSISTSGSLTSFNVTSDYRLKQDFKPFNGLDLVSKIKVYDYEWKADNSRMNGVIAHELQEVVPYAVTGEKDAEQMQSVDYSKLVPILVQAIQELKAEIEILKTK